MPERDGKSAEQGRSGNQQSGLQEPDPRASWRFRLLLRLDRWLIHVKGLGGQVVENAFWYALKILNCIELLCG
jgi:hypothetical protein